MLYGDLQSAGYRGFGLNEDRPTSRRIAYGRLRDARAIVGPLDTRAPLHSTVHQLWLAPGAAVQG